MTSSNNAPERLAVCDLWEGPSLHVVETRWSRHTHPADSEASTHYAAVEFMQRGTFRKKVGNRTVVGDPNTAVFFNPGEVFTLTHQHCEWNCGVTIRLSPDVAVDLEEANGTLRATCGPFRATHAVTPAGLHLALQILVADFRNGDDDPLSLEERTLGILEQVLAQRGCNNLSSPASDARTQKRLADVLEYLSAKRCEQITLDDVGRIAGCSSWHAARVFREHMGLPIHRYLKRLRLRHALAAVAQGFDDLTQLALQCGFSSHSHMTAAFRTEFGAVPRTIRQRCVQHS